MEDCFMLPPIKQTEHKRRITMEVSAMPEKFSDQEELPFPKLIRISMIDPYATDSSGDEDDDHFGRWRVKKYVNEISIHLSCEATMMPFNGNMTTPRNNSSAVESKQKAMVYDNAAIKLCCPGAVTNFVMPTVLENPPPTNVTSMSDHHPNRKSLKLPLADAPPLAYQSFDSIQLGDEVASFNMHHDFGSINSNQFDDFGITRIAHNFIPEIGRGSPSTLKIDNYFEDISDSTLDSWFS
ncbi:ethylene-responsive transcription factor CRF4-like [Cynara cardunculus var. scolymus]|uniref:ethylene-responsive transcription factor CRF4-like n=1 Tax=Cynara cardunculus var. scolymus TaxID=59895 RepID=UPI000D62E920|nr:ethylene-responsive transcription factor CRF4-like [Cynara cardunculus var. scolymus]